MDIFNYIEKEKYKYIKNSLKPGEDKVIFERTDIKITLKRRKKKIYTFIDEFEGKKNINDALNEMIKLF